MVRGPRDAPGRSRRILPLPLNAAFLTSELQIALTCSNIVTYCNMHQYFLIRFSSFLLVLSLFVWEPSSIHFLYEMPSVDDFPLRSHVQHLLARDGLDAEQPEAYSAYSGPRPRFCTFANWMPLADGNRGE